MATDSPASLTSVRISLIAGRYLVFDPTAVAQLRREWNTCGNLVGTVPQQPTQNIFLGLPIELRPEEVESLVKRGAAHVVDDVAAHREALNSGNRGAYVESLRRKKHTAQRLLAERTAQRAAEVADRLGRKQHQAGKAGVASNDADNDDAAVQKNALSGITPTTSDELVSHTGNGPFAVNSVPEGPLARFLQNSGYYMTPGLRFGARYSVYPGDPLRFHAHYMANQYDWDEEVPILEIVQGGRLATAVKKAFLIGAQEPPSNPESATEPETRTFSIEWASM